jgi:hypothetical protein
MALLVFQRVSDFYDGSIPATASARTRLYICSLQTTIIQERMELTIDRSTHTGIIRRPITDLQYSTQRETLPFRT